MVEGPSGGHHKILGAITEASLAAFPKFQFRFPLVPFGSLLSNRPGMVMLTRRLSFGGLGTSPPCGASNATMSSLIAQKASSLESLNTMRMNKLAIQRSSNATMSSFLKWLHLVAFDTTRQSSLCAFATLNIFREASTSRSFFDIQRVISTAQKLRCAQ